MVCLAIGFDCSTDLKSLGMAYPRVIVGDLVRMIVGSPSFLSSAAISGGTSCFGSYCPRISLAIVAKAALRRVATMASNRKSVSQRSGLGMRFLAEVTTYSLANFAASHSIPARWPRHSGNPHRSKLKANVPDGEFPTCRPFSCTERGRGSDWRQIARQYDA